MNHYLWRARRYYRQVAGLLLIGSLFGIVMNVTVVLPPVLLGRAVDAALSAANAGLSAGDSGTSASSRALLWAALAYAGATSLHAVARVGKRWYLRAAVRRTVFAVRNDALRGLLATPLGDLRRQSVGDLMVRVIGDSEVFGTGFSESTNETWDTWLFSISLIVTMLLYDPLLTALALLPVPAAFYLAYRSRQWVRSRTLAVRQASATLTTDLQERLTGLRLLRLMGQNEASARRIDADSARLQEATLAETRLQAVLQPVYAIAVSAGVVVVVWLGGRRVLDGLLTTGALVGFIQLYLRFVGRGHRLPLFFNRIQSGGVAWDRLEPMLPASLPLEAEPPRSSFRASYVMGLYAPENGEALPGGASPGGGPLPLDVRDLTFTYPGAPAPALQGVSLSLPAGKMVGVTGPIGSGKSALLRAVLGLYPLDAGQVSVGGRPVESYPEVWRAARLRYVPQDPGLFSGTVGENIGMDGAYGPFDDREALLRAAALDADVARWPLGLDTPVGEGGVQVSGGQRERVALARALATSTGNAPGLLLMDDPFASIDLETEARIVAALRSAIGPEAAPEQRATMVLCSHRLAFFPQLDEILVLDGGRVVARGDHVALMAEDGLYARIYRAQHVVMGDTFRDGQVTE